MKKGPGTTCNIHVSGRFRGESMILFFSYKPCNLSPFIANSHTQSHIIKRITIDAASVSMLQFIKLTMPLF